MLADGRNNSTVRVGWLLVHQCNLCNQLWKIGQESGDRRNQEHKENFGEQVETNILTIYFEIKSRPIQICSKEFINITKQKSQYVKEDNLAYLYSVSIQHVFRWFIRRITAHVTLEGRLHLLRQPKNASP